MKNFQENPILSLYCFLLKKKKKNLQADIETDEVYAQMTLQPLSPVRQFWFFSWIYLLKKKKKLLYFWQFFYVLCTARAKRGVSSGRIGESEQTADKLFLQDIDGQRYKHSWRVLGSSPCCWKSFSSIGISSYVFVYYYLIFCHSFTPWVWPMKFKLYLK